MFLLHELLALALVLVALEVWLPMLVQKHATEADFVVGVDFGAMAAFADHGLVFSSLRISVPLPMKYPSQ